MYSVVLMAALNTSLATPDLGRRGGGGCCGCCGGGYGGCYGGGWGGCYGGGWGGCYGGGYGGWGGCYGGGWGGGYGGCYGGGWGGGYPVMMGGCYGGGMIMGGGMIIGGGTGGTGGTGGKDGKDGKRDGKRDGKGGRREGGTDEESRLNPGSAEVVLVVALPAQAKLFIDDKPTRSTGPTRVFVSPRLDGSRSYTYELKGEIQQEGRTRNVSQSVKVEPGRTTYVNLTFPAREVAQGNR